MKIKISIFESCRQNNPCGESTVKEWVTQGESIKDIKYQIDLIRSSKNEEQKKRIKMSLPAATISGVFSKRNNNALIEHSGLICIDIDGKDNPTQDMEDLKKKLSKLPYVMYCGLSVSGTGLFCIIQIATPENHLYHFFALQKEFREMGVVIDPACKDITRLRILSYDSNGYFNPEAELYTKCEKEGAVKVKQSREKAIQPKVTINKLETPLVKSPEEMTEHELCTMLGIYGLPEEKYPFTISTMANGKQRGIYYDLLKAINLKIDITVLYDDWISICILIASSFGKEGLNLFLATSQFYPNFTEEECTTIYNNVLKREYKLSTKRLSELIESYGL